MRCTETERRAVWWSLVLAGLVHVLFPGILLRTAQWGYRRLLAVEFAPEDGARTRVRAVGVTLLALASALRRYTADST